MSEKEKSRRKNKKEKNTVKTIIYSLIIISIIILNIETVSQPTDTKSNEEVPVRENSIAINIVDNIQTTYNISEIPEYNDELYIKINNNIPLFKSEEFNIEEQYTELDKNKARNSNNKNKLEKSKHR